MVPGPENRSDSRQNIAGDRHFDSELRGLKEQLLAMGGLVERSVEHAVEGLQRADRNQFVKLHEIEKEVNIAHKRVDEACVRLLALQQPMASDLRTVVAVIKINTDLERMGDQAVNIAKNAEYYLQGDPIKPLVDLPKMFTETRWMVKQALNSFVQADVALAEEVLRRDDVVDALKHKIMHDVLAEMKTRPEVSEQGVSLILIGRNLERIADHATNIAEDVIYAISGEDVRHLPHLETMREALKKEALS